MAARYYTHFVTSAEPAHSSEWSGVIELTHPLGRTPGFEGTAPPAGRELRDRRRGHQDPAGRQTALTLPNPLADFFPFIESPPSSPEPPKAWGFFLYSGPSIRISPGIFHGSSTVRPGRGAVLLTACAASTPKTKPAPAPAPVAAPVAPPLKSGPRPVRLRSQRASAGRPVPVRRRRLGWRVPRSRRIAPTTAPSSSSTTRRRKR